MIFIHARNFFVPRGGVFAAKAAKCPSLLIYQVTIGYFPYHKTYHNITNHIVSYKSGEGPGYPGGVPARKLFILTPPLPSPPTPDFGPHNRRRSEVTGGFRLRTVRMICRSSRGTGVAGVACARDWTKHIYARRGEVMSRVGQAW